MGPRKPVPAPIAPKPMKRVVEIAPIADRFIELPNPQDSMRAYGRNVYLELIDSVQRRHDFAIVVDQPRLESQSFALTATAAPDPCLVSAPPIPSAKLRARIDEISFSTGNRATKFSYGFKRSDSDNKFATGEARNEFPMTWGPKTNWFGTSFSDDSSDLHTGLELAHEVNFDVLWAGASLKRDEYHASLGLELEIERRSGLREKRIITASGSGFYFDLSLHFNLSGADIAASILAARRVALLDAMDRAVKATVDALTKEIGELPLHTTLMQGCGNQLFATAGADYRIPVGTKFYNRSQWKRGARAAVFIVESVFERTSILKVENALGAIQNGDELVSLGENQVAPEPVETEFALSRFESVQSAATGLTFQNIDSGRLDFGVAQELASFVQSTLERWFAGLKELATLPARIVRFRQYDQEYRGAELWRIGPKRATELASKSWAHQKLGSAVAWKKLGQIGDRRIIVALIDSGVDYNHRELRRNIFWDGSRNTPGWDFISDDERPFDDHSHGTEIASTVTGGGGALVGVAPNITLLPVKAFSPYGVTTSAALISSVKYALDQGAKILVLGWATRKPTEALEGALRLIAEHGALAVVAAGDSGMNLDLIPHYPASYKTQFSDNMLVVGGLGKQNELISNTGQVIDLFAPAQNIQVARPRDLFKLKSHSGLAAGFAAGAAALLWSQCPETAQVHDVRRALLEGAKPLETKGDLKQLYLPDSVDKINQVCKLSSHPVQ